MKKIKFLTPIILSLILILHFLMIIASVVPYNPLTNKIEKSVTSYVSPLFTQVWTLFAPNPVDSNDVIQIKLFSEDNKKSDWIDATTPLIEKMHRNYISPYNRMGRISQSLKAQLLTEDTFTYDLRKSVEDTEEGEKLIEKLDKEQLKKIKENEVYLLRYGAAYAQTIYPNEKFTHIKIRILNQPSIPFSKRNSKEKKEWYVIHEIDKKRLPDNVKPLM